VGVTGGTCNGGGVGLLIWKEGVPKVSPEIPDERPAGHTGDDVTDAGAGIAGEGTLGVARANVIP